MRESKRQVYLELASEIDWELCPFCKYWKSAGSCCDGGDCKHPLGTIIDPEDIVPGQDCFEFRPLFPVSDIADMVGIVLSEKFDPESVFFLADDTEKHISEVVGKRK